LVTDCDNYDYRFGKATHGYLPDKGPQPAFAAKGPNFKENVVLEQGLLVDEAPTFAKVLGLELPNADGKAMNEVIRERR
jgi:predicted AlkP superfamily pyrophosphatase or phosphodiesterase